MAKDKDPYVICRRCQNIGTVNCPNSSECFALEDKPYFKGKPKSNPIKAIIYYMIAVILVVVLLPIPIIKHIFDLLYKWSIKMVEWLQDKLLGYRL